MSTKLKVRFGEVKHGWYPLTIRAGEFEVFIDASNIPLDPIEQLVKAAENSCIYKEQAEVWLHTEPHFYKLTFEPDEDNICLKIFWVKTCHSITMPGNLENKEELEFECFDSSHNLLLSFWRGLKELASRNQVYNDAIDRIAKNINKDKISLSTYNN